MQLPREFDFHSHKDFREAQSNHSGVSEFVLDFSQTMHLDSSALGMLLLMREDAGRVNGKVRLINCRQNIKSLLEMANFHKLFDVA